MSVKHLLSVALVVAILAPGPALAALIGCWSFDEGSGTVAADECGGNDGTLHPGASWSGGTCGTALFLDGANGYVSIPNGPGLDGLTQMTIEAWLYLFSYPPFGRDILIAGIWGPSGTEDDAYKFSIAPDGRLILEVSDGNPDDMPNDQYVSLRASREVIPLNRWVHVSATFEPDLAPPCDPIRLYVDFADNSGDYSTETGQQTQSVHDTTQELWMGINEVGHHLNAIVDEVRLYDAVVSPSPSCPLAVWSFEAPCGGVIPDTTEQGHDLMPVNCPGLATRQDGMGQAGSFDGTDDRYETPDALEFHNLGWLMIEAAVFPIAPIAGRNLGIVTKWGPGLTEDDCFFLVYEPDGRIWGAIQGSSRVDVHSADPLPLLTWSHVWMIYDGSALTLYVNDTLAVGRNDFDSQSPGTFWGYIDDAAIYGQMIDSSDAPVTGPPTHTTLNVLPNPMNSGATLRFALPSEVEVTLDVFDAQGRLVRELPAGTLPSGVHQIRWDGSDQRGRVIDSGHYFCQLRGPGGLIASERLTVVR
jgi:hypothetical protein